MGSGLLHRGLDGLAVWVEDRLERQPQPFRSAPAAPLGCFGPLPPLPEPPPSRGLWRAPSPGGGAGDLMSIRATPARGRRRGTAILVPPWKIRSPALVGGYARLLSRCGHDVWLVCPPGHLERTPPGTRSGEAFVSLDLARLRAALEQLVLELRLCAAMAAARGPVGLLGLSLGGLAGALAATAPERLDFAALVSPPSLELVVARTGIGRRYRRLAERAGSDWPGDAAVATALSPLDPARRPPTAARLLVAAGLHDGIALPEGPAALAGAWGVAPRLYRRGHLSLLFLCRALRRDLADFVGGGRMHN